MIGTEMTELESVIIGEMFSDGGVLAEAMSELTSDDFSHILPKTIFESASATLNKGKKVDPLTIQSEWQPEQKDELKNYLYKCHQSVVTTEAYRQHFKMLKESAVIRRAKAKNAELYDLFSASSDIELLQEKAGEILQAFDNKTQSRCIDSVSCFERFINRIGKPRNYIKLGIKSIDYYLKVEKGDFIIIGGRPSSGKTALTLQFALNIAKSYKVLYFSFETSPDKLFDRIIANQTMTNFSKIKRNELSANEKQILVEQFTETFKNRDIVLVSAAGMSVTQIQSTAIQHKADVIFIDYLGLISSGNDKTTLYEKISKISVMLHTMAQSLDIAVFALCQLNRTGGTDPDMSALRDSGQIEQDADAILLLSKVYNDNGEVGGVRNLKIAKNKDGETGTITLYFQGVFQRFSTSEEAETYTDIPFPE